MDVVAYIEFNDEREQAQSSARRMSYQSTAVNKYAKESDNQRKPRTMYFAYLLPSTPGSRKCTLRILVSALYIGSRGHRIFNDVESN